jgi:hypothetical protein
MANLAAIEAGALRTKPIRAVLFLRQSQLQRVT